MLHTVSTYMVIFGAGGLFGISASKELPEAILLWTVSAIVLLTWFGLDLAH